ncbi:MAG: tRNA pseudouridine(13) synthase TruD [Kofleriaceae bacterium]
MDLPYLTADLPGTGGVLRTTPEDFVVDEEPAYLPSGEGEHVFVKIEKRGLTTQMAVDAIARALAVKPRDIGVAGMKDRHAVTRQWLSLPPPTQPDAVRALVLPDISITTAPPFGGAASPGKAGLAIIEVARHPHKLRTGHVRANRFQLRVRGCGDDPVAKAKTILDRLAVPPGAPNWYGEQRFGRDGDNAARGRAIVNGEGFPRDRKLARLLVSALQSELFNQWLIARMADGLYSTVLTGDVLHKVGGGMFTCEDAALDTSRLVAGEVVLTGPMFGDQMRRAAEGSPAGEREDKILGEAGFARDSFAAVRAIAEGTRRDATITVGSPTVIELDNPGINSAIEVTFTLPGGAYATAVMREVMK